jgi:hypothetical protein
MINMALMNRILGVDVEKKQVLISLCSGAAKSLLRRVEFEGHGCLRDIVTFCSPHVATVP